MKIKPLMFQKAESGDEFEFLIDYLEPLYELDIIDRYGVEFVTF